jgi:hypothetical protein
LSDPAQVEILPPKKPVRNNPGDFVSGDKRAVGAGRPKGSTNRRTKDARALLDMYGPKAFDTIKKLLDSKDERVALDAARDLLDRWIGKAKKNIEFVGAIGHFNLAGLTDMQIRNLEMALLPVMLEGEVKDDGDRDGPDPEVRRQIAGALDGSESGEEEAPGG